jgi:hypothetical protein
MKKVNLDEARADLSALVDNVSAAELRPAREHRRTHRPMGLVPGLKVPASFFEPLADDVLAAFEGR